MDEYELYLAGSSIPDIHKILKIPLSTIYFRLKQKGILRSIKESHILARQQGKFKNKRKAGDYSHSQDSKDKISKARLKWSDKNAKGFRITPNGYIEMTRGKQVGKSFHRIVGESLVGRKLDRKEVVHHKDGDKMNNHISNLEIISLEEHSRLHAFQNINNHKRDKKGRFIC